MSLTSDRNDPGLRVKDETGQQKKYLILSEEERKKGFIRPVRLSYVHLVCGAVTTMNEAIAETYARDPKFYGGTFCVTCRDHFPVGEPPRGEFVWDRPREETPLGQYDYVGT